MPEFSLEALVFYMVSCNTVNRPSAGSIPNGIDCFLLRIHNGLKYFLECTVGFTEKKGPGNV